MRVLRGFGGLIVDEGPLSGLIVDEGPMSGYGGEDDGMVDVQTMNTAPTAAMVQTALPDKSTLLLTVLGAGALYWWFMRH